MKEAIQDFFRRGLMACGLGPIVLAILYLFLGTETLTVTQVCTGIFSLTALAFLAGGMNAIYRMEGLPLMVAILIHGGVLYGGYLATYLLNGWLDGSMIALLVFTGIFVVGYLVIWAVIYAITKKRTQQLNEMLKSHQIAH